jgi:murein peptide amidase A
VATPYAAAGQVSDGECFVTIVSRVVGKFKRGGVRRTALGLLAVPLLMQSCEPACTPVGPAAPRALPQEVIGTSVQGRPIVAYHVGGTPGGKVVLAIGSIHGDEQTGIEIIDYIRDVAGVPEGLDVWVIESINPDGNALGTHQNARGVDLNRNFDPLWEPNDCAVTPLYCASTGPQSEPESQAIAAFLLKIKPKMTAWYHGPLHAIDRAVKWGVANDAVLGAYAGQVGYAVRTINCSPTGYCVGNATQYGNAYIPGSSAFVVELQTGVAGALTEQGVINHVTSFFDAGLVA